MAFVLIGTQYHICPGVTTPNGTKLCKKHIFALFSAVNGTILKNISCMMSSKLGVIQYGITDKLT